MGSPAMSVQAARDLLRSVFRFHKPTPIQEAAFSFLLQRSTNSNSGVDRTATRHGAPRPNNVILGARTGEGKTLAYLTPLLLWNSSQHLVIAPNRELASQILRHNDTLSNSKAFSDQHKVLVPLTKAVEEALQPQQSDEATSNAKHKERHRIIVASAGELINSREFPGPVSTVVIDEFDELFAGEHGPRLLHCLYRLGVRMPRHPMPVKGGVVFPEMQQDVVTAPRVVMVGATLPSRGKKSVMSMLQYLLKPSVVTADDLHTKSSTLQEHFIDVASDDEAVEKLAMHVTQSPDRSSLVFCNTVNRAERLVAELSRRHVTAACFHRQVPPFQRQELIKKLLDGELRGPVVCTDLLARGIDIHVDEVVQFDFAKDALTYIHRVGRTARSGRRGEAISYVRDEERPLAEYVKQCWQDETGEEQTKISELFSRRRSFRKRLRKQTAS